MIAETRVAPFGSEPLDWVLVALAAQRNVRRVYGHRCQIAGAAGLDVIRRELGTDDWYAAIAAAAQVVVDLEPNPLDQWPVFVRIMDRIGHQGAAYNVRGRHLLDPSARVNLWPNGAPPLSDRLSTLGIG